MAFTAKFDSVNLQNDQFTIQVTFSDSATGYTTTKTYTIPNDTTITQAYLVNLITDEGAMIKQDLTRLTQIQSGVGDTITI